MTVTVTFLQTLNTTNPEGIAETQDEWRGDRSEDAATVTLTFIGGTAQATVQAEIEAWFNANDPLPGPPPTPDPIELIQVTAKRDRNTGEVSFLDDDGRPWFTLRRDLSGRASPVVVDSDGNERRILSPQHTTLEMGGTVAEASFQFDEPYDQHPAVSFDMPSGVGNYKRRVSKTEASIAFETAPPPGTTVGVTAVGRK